jgi:hypothetical protein
LSNNTNSLPLRVNSKGSFTLHYAIWPYIGLISVILLVWLLIYLLTIFSRRHNTNIEPRRSSSGRTTRNNTIVGVGECEAATIVISPSDV